MTSQAVLRRRDCLVVGATLVAAALVGPLEHAAGTSVAWHMVQHLVLTVGAPPLLVLGHRRRLARTPAEATVAVAAAAFVATVVLGAWHLPLLYDGAVREGTVHGLEHTSLLVSSLVLWATLLDPVTPRGTSTLVLFVWSMPMAALGAAMTVATRPWYELGSGSTAARLGDQQLAGVLMWVVGGGVALGAGVSLFASWLAADGDGAPRARGAVAGEVESLPVPVATAALLSSPRRRGDGPPRPPSPPPAPTA